jgi:SWI/SNF-related matrix-associated actin-dependent regulator of chromatin subfamily A-like protein 1
MTTLFEHQNKGAEWLAARNRAYLADPPRLMKTRTLIRGLELAGVMRPLVLGPASSRTHWKREFGVMGWADNTNAVLSYEQVVRGGLTMRNQWKGEFDALVLDEAHYLRSMDAKRTKLVLGIGGYAREIPIVWGASGTPFWKHPGNGWTMLSTMFPRVMIENGLKTYADFMNRFCEYWVDRNGWTHVRGMKNAAELHGILDRVMLRREWADIGLDIPEIMWTEMPVEAASVLEILSMEARPEMAGIRKALEHDLGISATDFDDNGPLATYRRRVGEAKAAVVAEMIRDELEGAPGKVVVFAYHRSVLEVLRLALDSFGLVYIDGGTSNKMRDAAVDAFQTQPNVRVFLGQIQATREAITLNAGDTAYIVEPDWTANTNVQAGQRILAPGKHCQVRMVSLAGTLDEALVRRHTAETKMVAEIHARK